jgi:hypothetical protein
MFESISNFIVLEIPLGKMSSEFFYNAIFIMDYIRRPDSIIFVKTPYASILLFLWQGSSQCLAVSKRGDCTPS